MERRTPRKNDSRKSFGDSKRTDKPSRSSSSNNRDKFSNKGPRRSEGGTFSKPKKSFGENNGERPKAGRPSVNSKFSKPFKKDVEGGRAPFKERDKHKSFDNKSDRPKQFGDKRHFPKKRSFGETEDRPKRTAEDKKSEIKSRFFDKNKRNKDSNLVREEGKRPFSSKPPKPINKRTPEEKKDGIRLNRYIANSGVCSRRDADLLIEAGEITVNGTPITEMGYIVQPGDVVKYSGRTLKREKLVYVLLNKPKDFITTTNDPEDRKTVMDLVANAAKERLFPVGRLDRNTTGLLLLTNDGEMAEKLSHPSNQIKKIYQVTLNKPLEDEDFEKINKGVHLEDGIAEVDDIAIITGDKINLGLEIHIGRNRIVRRIFESLGYEVEKLDRVLYADLTKKDLPRGSWRYLTDQEIGRLKSIGKKK